MRSESKKTITDVDGQPHEYVCYQHGAREGVALMASLADVVAGPLGRLATATSGDEIDGDALGSALRDAAKALVQTGPANLLDRLFAHTMRDGQKVTAVFDKAYQGNYAELLEAAMFVIQANFGAVWTRVPFAAGALKPMSE